VKFRQIIEDLLSATSALEWRARVLFGSTGKGPTGAGDEADSVVVRRLLRRSPRWKQGHRILRSIAERQGDQELVVLCDEALARLVNSPG
jgi:hypothetical protein